MLDKLLKKNNKSIESEISPFPIISPKKVEKINQDSSPQQQKMEDKVDVLIPPIDVLVESVIANNDFIQSVSNILLNKLQEKYGFEPTDKYKEEIAAKKAYLNQLDAYLNEKREINTEVNNDLKSFLNKTSNDLRVALESFTDSIHSRIREAEKKYGIDNIKAALNIETNQESKKDEI